MFGSVVSANQMLLVEEDEPRLVGWGGVVRVDGERVCRAWLGSLVWTPTRQQGARSAFRSMILLHCHSFDSLQVLTAPVLGCKASSICLLHSSRCCPTPRHAPAAAAHCAHKAAAAVLKAAAAAAAAAGVAAAAVMKAAAAAAAAGAVVAAVVAAGPVQRRRELQGY